MPCVQLKLLVQEKNSGFYIGINTVLPRLSVPRLSGIRLSVHWVR